MKNKFYFIKLNQKYTHSLNILCAPGSGLATNGILILKKYKYFCNFSYLHLRTKSIIFIIITSIRSSLLRKLLIFID